MQVFALPDLDITPDALAFSPDGRLLAAWSWGQAAILDTATGAVRVIGEGRGGMGRAPGIGFTADGRGFVQPRAHERPPVAVYDVASGVRLREGPAGHGDVMRVGPGGRLVYLTHPLYRAGDSIVAWNPLAGKAGPAFAPHSGHIRLIAVSADEKRLATETTGAVRVWRLGGAKPPSRATRTFAVPRYSASGLTLSADGAFVALHAVGIGIGDVRTGEWWDVPGQIAWYTKDIAFHPSRSILAFVGIGGGRSVDVVFYDAAARAELKRFAWEIGSVTAPTFSPDGLRCAATSAGKVVIWDVDV